MSKVIIIGAGPMGLAAAYEAVKAGHDVDVLEAGDRPGGMAAHFDFEGLSIERFYHFCCLSDHDTMALLDELGLSGAMKWVTTSMGFYVDGKLYRWGDPFALLAFPRLGLIDKIRYGVQVFLSTKRNDWRTLDKVSARDWFVRWSGQRVYDMLWAPLLRLKFYELTDRISAAWIWQRIKRVGNSRKSLLEERLGYIEGGSETLVTALVNAIETNGGRIHLNSPASTILVEEGVVRGVETADGRSFVADHVISTAPTPVVPRMLSQAPALRPAYERIQNVGVICVIHKLKRSVTPHFWVNIADPTFEIPGVVEFSHLRPVGHTIVYVPYYMPISNPKWAKDNQAFIDESWGYIKRLNPALTDADRLGSHVGRLSHAQPVCEVGFAELIPDPQTPIKGLQIADTCFYYPEDRGVSESIRYAKGLVERLAATG